MQSNFHNPTVAEAERLSAAHTYFNTTLFDNQLEPCRLSIASNGNGKWRGLFSPSSCSLPDGSTTHQILLDTDYASECLLEGSLRLLFSTLVHEMAHQLTYTEKGHHGPLWRTAMVERGLSPVALSSNWRSATHEVIDGGRYDRTFQELPSEIVSEWLSYRPKKVGVKAYKAKPALRCPVCGATAHASREGLELFCGSGHSPTLMLKK
jgi:hypothetical protein